MKPIFLKKLNSDLHFFKVVIARFLIILFRKRKNIEVLYLNYSDKHLFDTSYIVLNYHFKNAIWFRFGKHITTNKHLKIFNLKNFEKEFDLVVYGFFRKKTFLLKFESELKLETENFKTKLINLNSKIEFKDIPNFYRKPISIELMEMSPNFPKIKLQLETLKIKTNQYNQTDII